MRDITITEEFRIASNDFDIDIEQIINKLKVQLDTRNHKGIMKVRNIEQPLFRIHCKRDYRLFFQYSRNELRLLILDKKDENTYPRIRRLNKLFTQKAFKIDLEDLIDSKNNVVELDDTFQASEYLPNYAFDSKLFEVKEKYLHSRHNFKNYLSNHYQFHSIRTEEQDNMIHRMINDHDKPVWIYQGAAGTGKTTCALDTTLELASIYNNKIFLLLPTKNLSRWCIEHFKKRDRENFVHFSDRVEDYELSSLIAQDDKKILIGTQNDFFRLLIGKNARYFNPEKIILKIENEIRNEKKQGCYKKIRKFSPYEIYQLIENFLITRASLNSKDLNNKEFENLYNELKSSPLFKNYKEIKGQYLDHNDTYDLFEEHQKELKVRFSEAHYNIVLDESQDISIRGIKKIIDFFKIQKGYSNNKLIFLADTNQKININKFQLGKISEISNRRGLKTQKGNLKYNYRSSPEICRFAEKTLTDYFNDVVETGETRKITDPTSERHYSVHGNKPQVVMSTNKRIKKLLKEILLENKEIYDRDFCSFVIISNEKNQNAWIKKNPEFRDNVSFYTPEQAKGMEFDNTVIMNLFPKKEKPLSKDVKKLYTAITRAKHNLLLCISDEDYGYFTEKIGVDSEVIQYINDPEEALLKKLLKENGRNYLTHDQYIKSLSNNIEKIDFSDPYNEIESLMNNIEKLVVYGAEIEKIYDLVFLLIKRINASSLDISDFAPLFLERSQCLKALFYEVIGNTLKAIRIWKTNPLYPGQTERCIERNIQSTDSLEIFRSCIKAALHEKIENFKSRWNNSEEVFNELIEFSESMEYLDNDSFFMTFLNSRIKRVTEKTTRMNAEFQKTLKLIKEGVGNGKSQK